MGHLDDEAIALGKGTKEERFGNDGADDKAKTGVEAHESILNEQAMLFPAVGSTSLTGGGVGGEMKCG